MYIVGPTLAVGLRMGPVGLEMGPGGLEMGLAAWKWGRAAWKWAARRLVYGCGKKFCEL